MHHKIKLGYLTPVAVLTITLSSALVCFGQQTIAREVWQRYHRIAQDASRSIPYRIKITIEDKKHEDDAWRPYSESVMELIATPYRAHFIGKYLETIQIGKIVYSKRPDGTWLKKDLAKETPTNGTVQVIEQISDTYSQLEKESRYTQTSGEGSRTVLQAESVYKMKYLSDGMVFEHHDLARVWFDYLGRYEKTEKITYEPRRKVYIRRLEEYEYDPNIKIEAPIP